MMTFLSFFSGGGGADIGAKAAGFTPVCAVEFDPANERQSERIADCYELNIGKHVIRKPVQDVDIASLPSVDWFHASPVCKNFSTAKASGEENNADVITAKATADYIAHHKPRFVTIENVRAYESAQSFHIILKTLTDNGYSYKVDILNAADFGVPQTRIRLICRAVRGESVPMIEPTHTKEPINQPRLFGDPLKRWVGWYESVADLVDTFPDDDFAPWQKEKLKNQGFLFNGSFLMNAANPNGNEKRKWRQAKEPSKTITAGDSGQIKGFIVSGASSADVRTSAEPSVTCVSSSHNMSGLRAYLAEGRTGGDRGLQYRQSSRGAMTVTTPTGGNDYRYFLVNGLANDYGQSVTTRLADSPALTITASYEKHEFRSYVGRVCRVTPQGLARFMSYPDWYKLPENKGDACTLLGNSVPPTTNAKDR